MEVKKDKLHQTRPFLEGDNMTASHILFLYYQIIIHVIIVVSLNLTLSDPKRSTLVQVLDPDN